MLRLLLQENSLETALKSALQTLKNGGIIAYPTESFYALGVNAQNQDAIKRLYEFKKRPADKPVPLIAGSRKILKTLVKSIPLQAEGLMKKFWPGALTMVFDAADSLSDALTAGTGKVAVRIPGESFALYLAEAADFPITATSANHSGMPPACTPEEVINYFGEMLDLIIDAGKTPGGKPSTIIDITLTPFKVLREGRVKVKTAYNIPSGSKPERLDIYLSLKTGLSRGRIQNLIKQGLALVNSKTQKPSYRIRGNDKIEITIPDEPENKLIPEDLPLDILYEDEHIIAVNKPPGMVVYPAAGHRSGTLMNALSFRCKKLASTGAPLRPGVVHRLDKDTSGVMVIAKDDSAYLNLCRQFRERTVGKKYLALLFGSLKDNAGEISAPVGRASSDRKKMSVRTKKGKEAITRFEVIKRFKQATLVKVGILTGRTHQIRVHFASAGYPVLGDKTYGGKTCVTIEAKRIISFPRQMLHAHSLKIKHPVSGAPLEFTAPVPGDMKKAIAELS